MLKPAVLGGPRARTRPFPRWPQVTERDEAAVLEALRSGRWSRGFEALAGGAEDLPFATRLEQAVARLHQARFVLALSSGTAALDVAVRAAGLGPGDEVIVPAYSFVASATCVMQSGARPVFADIDPATLNLDAASAERAITRRTRGMVVVHLAGQPAEMDALGLLARSHDLALIEDAAQAVGAAWRGRPVGTLGSAGCLSLEASKNVACGEGGLLLTNDEALHRRACSLHSGGRRPGGPRYEHVRLGWNYRLPELSAALALSQLRQLEQQQARRERNAALLRRRLSGLEGLELLAPDPRVTRHANHLLVMRLDPERLGGLKRRRFVMALAAEGVPCSEGYPRPIPQLELFAGEPQEEELFPEALRAARQVVWLPHQVLLGQREDTEEVADAVLKIHQHRAQISGRRR